MIVYQNNLNTFIEDVVLNKMPDKLVSLLHEKHLSGGSPSEVNSWNNSLHFMKDVLDCGEISKDCEVAIEYNIPQTDKRVDFMILGRDQAAIDRVVIVELKQWAWSYKYDDVSKHTVKSDLRGGTLTAHPSYQAYSYKSLILNYCGVDGITADSIRPCAYLHNMPETFRPELEDKLYDEWIEEAPVFLQGDVLKLRNFISGYIQTKSSSNELLYQIDTGRIRPTKALQDSIDSMLCGNKEFEMIDEQAVAYDYIQRAVKAALKDGKKHVVIITGGPGTGKSVLAVNLLANAIRKGRLNASYITKNSAPRNCYSNLLAHGHARELVNLSQAFMSPHKLPSIPENGIDIGIYDEAHRMQKKPYRYKGDDMLKDAIRAARVSVFFVDEDQRITTKDCYSVDTIKEYAEELGAIVDTKEAFELESQFRCNGSDGYIAFLDNLLGIKETANTVFDFSDYHFEVCDTPEEMKEKLRLADNNRNKSRMAAGYCYDWNVKNHRGEWDIVIGDFKAKWNLENDSIFAINPDSFDEVGCIHTVQGMEFDYAGIIIGKDLIFRNGEVMTNQAAISKDDRTSGIRGCKDAKLADRLIRNTYKVLLTRGQKGCFVYAEDEGLREYIRDILK